MQNKNLILIDIGGTSIKYSLFSPEDNTFLQKGNVPTPKGGEKILLELFGIIDEYRGKSDKEIAAVAVSSAGIIDSDKGIVYEANEALMPGYKGTRLAESIKEFCALDCHVENDVNCAALAEYYSGAARGASGSLMLTIGTGIGGAYVFDGHLLKGHCFSACEVGYMHMGDSSFEELGATSVLVGNTAKALGIDKSELSGKDVFDRAESGDEICVEQIDNMCEVLSRGIANICYILNPEVVVIGGGISARKDYLFPILDSKLERQLIPTIYENTSLRFAENENDAGMLGAFYAWKIANE